MPSTRPQPARRIVFRGLKIDLALQSVVLADGTIADREVVVHRGAVALVPMVDADRVCLVRNERHAIGPGRRGGRLRGRPGAPGR
ncbi:MAG: hypothetical protein ACXVCF_18290, partial [Isosphaeraceae bacterium]